MDMVLLHRHLQRASHNKRYGWFGRATVDHRGIFPRDYMAPFEYLRAPVNRGNEEDSGGDARVFEEDGKRVSVLVRKEAGRGRYTLGRGLPSL